MGRMLLFAVWLLCCQLAACKGQAAVASESNEGMAARLLGAANACSAVARQPTLDDVFLVAEIRTVALLPQVDNVTSDLSSPKLLWSWSANYPQSAAFPLSGSQKCKGGTMEISNPQPVALSDAMLEYGIGNVRRSVPLGMAGPNPVPLEIEGANFSPSELGDLYANLSAKLTARLSVNYRTKTTEYIERCVPVGKFTVCGCESSVRIGRRSFEKRVEDSRVFGVEVGPQQLTWLSPPIGKRLPGKQHAQALLFARRLPAKIGVVEDGKPLGENSLLKFENRTGVCGEKVVATAMALEENGVSVRMENATTPHQLVGKNASYLPYRLDFVWDAAAGKKQVEIEMEDRFGNSLNVSSDFQVRSPAPFAVSNASSAMAIRNGSAASTPAAYPTQAPRAVMPDYSSLAALLSLPFALLALALIRRLAGRTE